MGADHQRKRTLTITQAGDRSHCSELLQLRCCECSEKEFRKRRLAMKVLAVQNVKHGIESGMAQVLVVLVLVTPSLFAFLASLTFHSPWATGPGLWFCYQMSLNIGYGAIPVAVG